MVFVCEKEVWYGKNRETFSEGAFTRFWYDNSSLDFTTTCNKEIQALPKTNAKQQHTISFSKPKTGTQEEARV